MRAGRRATVAEGRLRLSRRESDGGDVPIVGMIPESAVEIAAEIECYILRAPSGESIRIDYLNLDALRGFPFEGVLRERDDLYRRGHRCILDCDTSRSAVATGARAAAGTVRSSSAAAGNASGRAIALRRSLAVAAVAPAGRSRGSVAPRSVVAVGSGTGRGAAAAGVTTVDGVAAIAATEHDIANAVGGRTAAGAVGHIAAYRGATLGANDGVITVPSRAKPGVAARMVLLPLVEPEPTPK